MKSNRRGFMGCLVGGLLAKIGCKNEPTIEEPKPEPLQTRMYKTTLPIESIGRSGTITVSFGPMSEEQLTKWVSENAPEWRNESKPNG